MPLYDSNARPRVRRYALRRAGRPTAHAAGMARRRGFRRFGRIWSTPSSASSLAGADDTGRDSLGHRPSRWVPERRVCGRGSGGGTHMGLGLGCSGAGSNPDHRARGLRRQSVVSVALCARSSLRWALWVSSTMLNRQRLSAPPRDLGTTLMVTPHRRTIAGQVHWGLSGPVPRQARLPQPEWLRQLSRQVPHCRSSVFLTWIAPFNARCLSGS